MTDLTEADVHKAADDIRSVLKMPEDYTLDIQMPHIIVKSTKVDLGFCITENVIRDGLHLNTAPPAFKRLQELVAEQTA